jgi:hypothetical protein
MASLANKEEVKVGFNWIIQIPFYYLVYLCVIKAMDPTTGNWNQIIYILIFLFLMVSGGMKCTSVGWRFGFNFFSSAFTLKKLVNGKNFLIWEYLDFCF